MTENRVWYVNANRKTYGPYTKDEVINMLRSGSIKHNDYIFKEGYNDWDFIYNVAEFDRRLIMPDGGQPLVEAPKAEVPVEETAATPEGQDLWFVHDGENQMGPYASNYIKEALNNKTIFWTYYVWREGFENWVQIKDCKEFDRRKLPRGQAPVSAGITKDFEEIKKQALPTLDQNRELYGNVEKQTSSQYGLSEEDQEELKGKYPVKAIFLLIFIAVVLFGTVRVSPSIIHGFKVKMKENKAASIYDHAQSLIKQNKTEEAYNELIEMSDLYPDTKAARKTENDFRVKDPAIKSQFADETRRVKNLMESYAKRYGVMPTNSMDINYVPPFYMKYFAETYFKRDTNGRIALMTKGVKIPVQQYAFLIDGNGKEVEHDNFKPEEFALESQAYIKLSYQGKRSVVKPLDIPQIIKKDLERDDKNEKSTPALEVKAKEPVKRSPKRTPVVREDTQDDVQDNNDTVDDTKQNGKKAKGKKAAVQTDEQQQQQQEVTEDNVTSQDEASQPTEQYTDEINKIRTDK